MGICDKKFFGFNKEIILKEVGAILGAPIIGIFCISNFFIFNKYLQICPHLWFQEKILI